MTVSAHLFKYSTTPVRVRLLILATALTFLVCAKSSTERPYTNEGVAVNGGSNLMYFSNGHFGDGLKLCSPFIPDWPVIEKYTIFIKSNKNATILAITFACFIRICSHVQLRIVIILQLDYHLPTCIQWCVRFAHWRGVFDTTLCDKVFRVPIDRFLLPGTYDSSSDNIYTHDIPEILFQMALRPIICFWYMIKILKS